MSTSYTAPTPPNTVLIVGAGAFGAALALSLIKGPYKGHEHLITIQDRSAAPPAQDAASSDYNKIVRSDYTDPFYATLANDALVRWRSSEYRHLFHESGVLMGSQSDDPQASYVRDSLAVNSQPGMGAAHTKAFALNSPAEVKNCYGGAPTGAMEGMTAYLNTAGGWADSRGACVDILDRCRAAGVRFDAGEAETLLFAQCSASQMDVKGIKTRDGRSLYADLVVLAAGAWSSRLLPELGNDLLPTGQTVGTMHLTKEEVAKYGSVPVTLLLDTGFYCFPPTPQGVFKFAIHDRGWVNPAPALNLPSVPRTTLTPGFENQEIPASARAVLQGCLEQVYPELAKKKWSGSRLCWYTDRPSGDFLFDYHPSFPSLFLATGGSGHAFKFLPLLGDFALAALENRLTAQEKSYWSFAGDATRIDKSRGEEVPVRKMLVDKVVDFKARL